VLGLRLTILSAAALLGAIFVTDMTVHAGDATATPPSSAVSLPPQRPDGKAAAAKSPAKTIAKTTAKTTAQTTAKHQPDKKPVARTSAPLSIAPTTAGISAAPANVPQSPVLSQAAPALRPVVPFAVATGAAATPLDIAAVKQAIDLVGKNRQDEAAGLESTINDPVARKLVEWVILRSDGGSSDYTRYLAFIAANPSWPSIATIRRRAEGVLWEENVDAKTVMAFFATEQPHTVKGHFALARALLAQGDTAGAAATLHDTWRNDGFSADLEQQARQMFAGLILPADDRVRMDARFYAEDDDAGLRLARRLDPTVLAIAKARAAVINDASNAKALLDAVPESARYDPGYMFSRIQLLRRQNKIPEAAQLMMASPHDPAALVDVDQWWVERRVIARKLLDLGDARMAYEIANGAAAPVSDNFRAEQHFTSGWIALSFLHQPAIALAHFARIGDGATSPITLARSFYWQGRAAEALGRGDARAFYEAAARYSTAYYGQLARARLSLDEVSLRSLPEPVSDQQPLEIARAYEILYTIDNRDLIASMSADIGDKATDAAGMATLAALTARHGDARATLLIGKTALNRGYPFERYAFPDFGVPAYQQIGPEVEPCVVYSIVRQESAFNPQVVSSANAIGLMQVTPDAGRDTAKRFGVSFDRRRLANDVVYNAQLGTAELGNEISSWRGSYILSFVAYNAGPRRSREWIEQYGDPRDPHVDPIDWIERIPISETRNYVQRVIENMQVYRALIENNPKLLIEADLHRGR
jgi:soluble lytic murein transglycosylase